MELNSTTISGVKSRPFVDFEKLISTTSRGISFRRREISSGYRSLELEDKLRALI